MLIFLFQTVQQPDSIKELHKTSASGSKILIDKGEITIAYQSWAPKYVICKLWYWETTTGATTSVAGYIMLF